MDQIQIWRRSTQHALLSLHFSIYDKAIKNFIHQARLKLRWSHGMAVFKYILILSTASKNHFNVDLDGGLWSTFFSRNPRDNRPFVMLVQY